MSIWDDCRIAEQDFEDCPICGKQVYYSALDTHVRNCMALREELARALNGTAK